MTLLLGVEGCEFDTQSIHVIFVFYLEKALYDKFFNGVSRGLYNFESVKKKKVTVWPLRSYKKNNSKRIFKP